jgi:ubiquinone/menaquinone biosynthesis C-methylase UbiE
LHSSIQLYNSIAQEYDSTHWNVAHRKAYDILAWEYIAQLLPSKSAMVIDAGCGTGRWIEKLSAMGHSSIGIEQAPGMIHKIKSKSFDNRFTLIEGDIANVTIAQNSADAVLAMGSLQYTRKPREIVKRFMEWVKPGGFVAVLVDSYVSLVLELLNFGKVEEARKRLESRIGVWQQGDLSAEYHLLDKTTLESIFAEAGLQRIRSHGLLCAYHSWGKTKFAEEYRKNREGVLEFERRLAECPDMVDNGKQILIYGFKP